MRFPVPLVIEIPDDQLAAWADKTGTPRASDGRVRARDAVDSVRGHALVAVQAHFDELGVDAEILIR